MVEIDISNLSFDLTQIGSEGGLFRVDGQLSEAAEIHVNGFKGKVSHQSGNQTWFSIPSFDLQSESSNMMTGNYLSKGNKDLIFLLNKKNINFNYISDLDADGKKAFDQNIEDRYKSTDNNCYIGIKVISDDALMELKEI